MMLPLFLPQDGPDLTQILQSFNLPESQLEFSFEELYKATTMSKTVSQLWGETFQQLFDSTSFSCVSNTQSPTVG